jgi:hypothetical protein
MTIILDLRKSTSAIQETNNAIQETNKVIQDSVAALDPCESAGAQIRRPHRLIRAFEGCDTIYITVPSVNIVGCYRPSRGPDCRSIRPSYDQLWVANIVPLGQQRPLPPWS